MDSGVNQKWFTFVHVASLQSMTRMIVILVVDLGRARTSLTHPDVRVCALTHGGLVQKESSPFFAGG